MIEINGRPILSYQIEWMRSQGVTDVVFLCGYRGDQIESYFGDGSAHGITAHYSFEDVSEDGMASLGRGGAVRKGLSLVPPDASTVVVTNGDNITNQDLSELWDVHRSRNALATIMLHQVNSPYGMVKVQDDGAVTEFIEKGALPILVNAGVYLFDRSLEQRLPERGDHEVTTFPELAAERRMFAIESNAMWLTVDSHKDIETVAEQLRAVLA